MTIHDPRITGQRRYLRFLTLPLLVLGGCSDAGLQYLKQDLVTYVDDKLSISGQFCTKPADEVPFPVKILIVIDQSASLQCTDPGNNRLTALDQAGTALDSLPNVQFGVVGFASWSRVTPFNSDWNVARAALAPESGQGGPATDYQGALSTVLRVIEQDILASGSAQTARTKYLVLFVSDGIPEPRCRAGCDDGDTLPDSLYGVCNTDQEIPDGVYVDMLAACPDYNQPSQILQKVDDVMALGDFYGVGDMTFNTVFLFAPEGQLACPAAQFGYVREEAMPLLRSMAEEGRGTFRDVNISTELDFLDFNYESLKAPYELIELFAINSNAVPSESGSLADSDGDGLDDTMEFAQRLDRLSRDSDGDRFSDLLEQRYASKGFDPLDPAMPAIGCTDTQDRDGDGLLGCEEAFLKTDPQLPDTDDDRIPDGIELRFGTDPTVADTLIDHDFDGRLSGAEIRAGTNPLIMDSQDVLSRQILYSVNLNHIEPNESRCYDISVQGVTLVQTLSRPTEPKKKGQNRLLIYAEEAPRSLGGSRGGYSVACVEARYLGDTFKDPPSGQISGLAASRFVAIQVFDPDVDCLKPGDDPTAAPDEGSP